MQITVMTTAARGSDEDPEITVHDSEDAALTALRQNFAQDDDVPYGQLFTFVASQGVTATIVEHTVPGLSHLTPLPEDLTLYEKCSHCHLFIEQNTNAGPQNPRKFGAFFHLTRGDSADERFEDHEPAPSGMTANLNTWRVFGPSLMRERFVNHP